MSLLMRADDSVLLIVDVQDKLLGVIPDANQVIWNLQRLADGATALNVPCLATEQYPEKLGPTRESLRQLVTNQPIPGKLTFSCLPCDEFRQQLETYQRRQVVVAGIEAHVCVLQTAMDLIAEGYDVFVVADAVAARRTVDTEIALRRLELAGATLVTTEAALFEWCGRAGTDQFKAISIIVRTEPS